MKICLKMLVVLGVIVLSGCYGSYYEPEPVGIGTGSDELKLSPCACMEIELPKNLPDWFVATI
ncbi:MAG: hypothetical protein E7017_03645 [Alphaproteobacteria bacterium]|nr:hypothetical protein [Alphaproteobacteria bacterium]